MLRNNSARIMISSIVLMFQLHAGHAGDLCADISDNPEIESFFAENRTNELSVIDAGSKRPVNLEAVWQGSRTCRSKEILSRSQDGSNVGYDLICSYNGCASGKDVSIVARDGSLYFLTESRTLALDELKGWDRLPAHEQKILNFRNGVFELYKASSDGTASSICERTGSASRSFHDLSLIRTAECSALSSSAPVSIFDDTSTDDSGAIEGDRERFSAASSIPALEYRIYPKQSAMVDIDGTGRFLRFARGAAESTAGCGCDFHTFSVVDGDGRPIFPEGEFYATLMRFAEKLECGASLDIVTDGRKYYLEKTRRSVSRELFSLSPGKPIEPICAFVNDTPLAWHSLQ